MHLHFVEIEVNCKLIFNFETQMVDVAFVTTECEYICILLKLKTNILILILKHNLSI